MHAVGLQAPSRQDGNQARLEHRSRTSSQPALAAWADQPLQPSAVGAGAKRVLDDLQIAPALANGLNKHFACVTQAFPPCLLSSHGSRPGGQLKCMATCKAVQALFNEMTLRIREQAGIMVILCFKQNDLRLPGDSYFDSMEKEHHTR